MTLVRELRGYRLTFAEIRYYHPDHPRIINPHSFLWQELDLPPKFPVLQKFLEFWEAELDARIHSVTVKSAQSIKAAEFRIVGHEMWLH